MNILKCSMIIHSSRRGVSERLKSLQLHGRCVRFIEDEPAPHLALRKSVEVKSGDDAEIIETAFERFEEIRMGVYIGIHNAARAKDNLCPVSIDSVRQGEVRIVPRSS